MQQHTLSQLLCSASVHLAAHLPPAAAQQQETDAQPSSGVTLMDQLQAGVARAAKKP
jgi:hypothetical protein